jgi:hypothetical protein
MQWMFGIFQLRLLIATANCTRKIAEEDVTLDRGSDGGTEYVDNEHSICITKWVA